MLTPSDTCADGAWNYVETDEDCGGPQCNSIGIPCVLTKKCGVDADCASGMCKATAPSEQALCISCGDGVKNGDESDTDCGGATWAKSAKSQCIAEPQYVGS